MSWIEFCRCHRRILTTGQMRDNQPCEICQKEHADSFKERIEEAQTKEEV